MKKKRKEKVIDLNNKKKVDETVEKNEKIINEVFGNEAPSLSEIKKLKTDKVMMLARYLNFAAPVPTLKSDVKEAREHCSKNLWQLQNLWEDVEAALTTAHRAFSARIGEYKKLLKTLVRVVNETYGMWSV